MKYRLAIVILFVHVSFASGNFYEDVESKVEFQCIQHCPLQNRTDIDHYEYACDYNCNIEQCASGCKLWKKALTSSCQKICNGTLHRLTSKELYCIMGCNDAIDKYISELRVRLGVPPAPALMAGSLMATSLKLEWKFPEAGRMGLTSHVQWKYEEFSASWQYSRNATWSPESSSFYLTALQPYTKYRFRIVLNLDLGHSDPIYSAPSVVISTLASGVPASPPANVRATPVDPNSVSISWEPGPFPHGPLLSYVLLITENHQPNDFGENTFSEIKDISPDLQSYMVRNLKPKTNYTVGVRMRNSFGPGPSANLLVLTPEEMHNTEDQNPILIVGTEHSIVELEYIFREPLHLFHSDLYKIEGIDIHIAKKILFISDTNGSIWRIPIEQETKNKTQIINSNDVGFIPLDLAVDWLNNHLYVLGKKTAAKDREIYVIKRCDLEGNDLVVAYAGLSKKPSTLQVDPCNGYIFWIIQGEGGGLYRLDISDISNGVRREVNPIKIIDNSNLGAFVVDHPNFRLLVSYQSLNTINAVSIDGREVIDVRPNVATAKFQKVISLARANRKFVWTDGDNVYFEEYHKESKWYFHNQINHLTTTRYKKILINLLSNQPWPMPVNPPIGVQAIFGSDKAKIKWQSPHLLGLQGRGAWQNWSYEISVKESNSSKLKSYRGINNTVYTIENLTESTEYVIKVSAYSKSAQGPWSSEFKGSTISKEKDPTIFWSAGDGLLISNSLGENLHNIIDSTKLENVHFKDMSWYKDQIYLLTNSSEVYYYNRTSENQGKLIGMDAVGSIAVDWIGKKLYWSNLKKQLIIRGNFNGTQQEPLPIITLARELNIDSVKAFLYWSSEYVVECSHLNGADRMEYHHVELFSGKQVMGLTLDVDQKYVYWIIRGSDGSNLFRAPMAGYDNDLKQMNIEKVASLQKANMQGPISYYHKRLLWLQDQRNAVVSDLRGKYLATLSGDSVWGLNMVYVLDESLRNLPGNFTLLNNINVVPETVDRTSVKVEGSSESFNITWNPVTTVTYGTVFYEIHIEGLSLNNTFITTIEPTIRYWKYIAPFTKIFVEIRAYTYWATSPQIRAAVYSPPSTPSVPRNLRSYVVYEYETSFDCNNCVTVTFRWDAPLHPNGVLQGYKIKCWFIYNETEVDICDNDIITADNTEYIISRLKTHEIYYFQVQAYTEIGYGTLSIPIYANTSRESPVPTVLVGGSDSVFLQDMDSNKNYSIIRSITLPIDISCLMRESKVVWMNNLRELYLYNFNTANKSKMYEFEGTPASITVDWLERSLYYVEFRDVISTIYKIDLNYLEVEKPNVTKLFSVNANISSLEISPFTKKLYWTEKTTGQTYELKKSNFDGTSLTNFFSVVNRNKRQLLLEELTTKTTEDKCNCSAHDNVEPSFALDHSKSKSNPDIIFINSETKDILRADRYGCICEIMARANNVSVKKIKADFLRTYFLDRNGSLYMINSNNKNILTKDVHANDISIYGQHTQPYPAYECLIPNSEENTTVEMKSKSSDTLLLQMPEYSRFSNCSDTSFATVIYTVNYKKLDDNSTVNQFKTFAPTLELKNLKPFSEYEISVAIGNYFTRKQELKFGPPVTIKTAPGAPSPPRNVSASVLQPTLARVNWLPPEQLNGAVVNYEVHWLTQDIFSRQKGEQPVLELEYVNNSVLLTTLLQKLVPNETYTIWIRAYSETNETSSDSSRVKLTTFPEPEDFVLVNQSSRSLIVDWSVTDHIKQFYVEYAPSASMNEWSRGNYSTKDNSIRIEVNDLKPKTRYKFRLSLLYSTYPEWYIWPKDSRFTFETLGDRPSPPGVPIIQYVKPNVYKVVWEASQENGAPIELYMLEGLKIRSFREKRSTTNRSAWFYSAPSIEEEQITWESLYNGTDNSWIINGLSEEFKYAFRALALNSYGWSEPSAESTEFDISEAESMIQKQSPMNLIFVATFVPISICLAIVICFAYMTYSGRCKPKKEQEIVAVARGPDVELATLRELPRRGIHNTNILYVSTVPTSEELTMLPHIRRDQITLTKFLGSGAFGEVFEGLAKNLGNGMQEAKIAVKTLKEGASQQEKNEFLQEAQLMSHFKHEHILQLLGVCLDNDPHFIIMELMAGGDLLTFLRDSRIHSHIPSLNLLDLLKMCVDVSKGCKYLEEMHFVHRDLACRNCLVSSIDSKRIVKIGDFGLARDIYKNDYYRKEGEGLLPVRWMAPESLTDGVFTCQSDVWAFGVLLWEIMTLGQQPYQARSNLEVLHYVRGGGRLGKPTDCPDELYKLMLSCWKFEAEKRPSFKYCVEVLDSLHQQHIRSPITGAHLHYTSTVPNSIPWKHETEDENKEQTTPFLSGSNPTTPKEIPKYLELVYEPEPENDGYEIPTHLDQTLSTASCSQSDNLVKNEGPSIVQNDTIDKKDTEVPSTKEIVYSNLG